MSVLRADHQKETGEIMDNILSKKFNLRVKSFLFKEQQISGDLGPGLHVLGIYDGENKEFHPLLTYHFSDWRELEPKALKRGFTKKKFLRACSNDLYMMRDFRTGVKYCAEQILRDHLNEFDPNDDLDEFWKQGIRKAYKETLKKVHEELPLLSEKLQLPHSVSAWSFGVFGDFADEGMKSVFEPVIKP